MTNKVKKFIEDNIDSIDNEDWMDVFLSARDEFYPDTNGTMKELVDVLNSIDIDTTPYRWSTYEYVLMRTAEQMIEDHVFYIGPMSLDRFHKEFMRSTFGFDYDTLVDYLQNNIEEYGLKLFYSKISGKYLIRKK